MGCAVTRIFTESVVEDAAFEWLKAIGWSLRHGLEVTPDEPGAECTDYAQVVLGSAPAAQPAGGCRSKPHYASCVYT